MIIYGHSHKYEEKHKGSQLWLNPGSCGPGRFLLPVAMAVLLIAEDGSCRVEKAELSARRKTSAVRKQEAFLTGEELSGNIRQMICAVMRETKRGKTVTWIAGKYGISEALAEQICRLYVTHPGVDADGIMAKMGL